MIDFPLFIYFVHCPILFILKTTICRYIHIFCNAKKGNLNKKKVNYYMAQFLLNPANTVYLFIKITFSVVLRALTPYCSFG